MAAARVSKTVATLLLSAAVLCGADGRVHRTGGAVGGGGSAGAEDARTAAAVDPLRALPGGAGDVIVAAFFAPWCAACKEGGAVRRAWEVAAETAGHDDDDDDESAEDPTITTLPGVRTVTIDVATPEGLAAAETVGVNGLPAIWAVQRGGARGVGSDPDLIIPWALRYRGPMAKASLVTAFVDCVALRRCAAAEVTFYLNPPAVAAGDGGTSSSGGSSSSSIDPSLVAAAQRVLRGRALLRSATAAAPDGAPDAAACVRVSAVLPTRDLCVPRAATPAFAAAEDVVDFVYDHAMPRYVGELDRANPWREAFLHHPHLMRVIVFLPADASPAVLAAWDALLEGATARSPGHYRAARAHVQAEYLRGHCGVDEGRPLPVVVVEDPLAPHGVGRWVWDVRGPWHRSSSHHHLGSTLLKRIQDAAAAANPGGVGSTSTATGLPTPSPREWEGFLDSVADDTADELVRVELAPWVTPDIEEDGHDGGRGRDGDADDERAGPDARSRGGENDGVDGGDPHHTARASPPRETHGRIGVDRVRAVTYATFEEEVFGWGSGGGDDDDENGGVRGGDGRDDAHRAARHPFPHTLVYVWGAVIPNAVHAPPRALRKLAHRHPNLRVFHYNIAWNDIPRFNGAAHHPARLPTVWYFPAGRLRRGDRRPLAYLGPINATAMSAYLVAKARAVAGSPATATGANSDLLEIDPRPFPTDGFFTPRDGFSHDPEDPRPSALHVVYHDFATPQSFLGGRSAGWVIVCVFILAPSILLPLGLVLLDLAERLRAWYYRRAAAQLLRAQHPHLTAARVAEMLAAHEGREYEYYARLVLGGGGGAPCGSKMKAA